MKKFWSVFALAIVVCLSLASCSKDDEPKESYNFIGSYYGYDAEDGTTKTDVVLEIRSDRTFSHILLDDEDNSRLVWDGTWVYDQMTNVITMHYLTEKYTDSDGREEIEVLDNDYCWAQPYDNGNKLRYKEYIDDDWEIYDGWIKKK